MAPSRKALTAAAVGSVAASGIGGLGARRAPDIYRQMDKPAWAPPAWVFGPVWTVLYALMAVAAARLSGTEAPERILALHGAQLALNASWPLAFFSRRSRGASLVIIAALDGAVALEVLAARRRDRWAAALLTPYLIWCLFATALNASVKPAEGGGS